MVIDRGLARVSGVGVDSKHRLFTVCAATWAVLAPWLLDVDRCAFGGLRAWIWQHVTDTANCSDGITTALTIVAACSLPPLLAYLAIFIAAPPVARWISAGE